MALEMNDLMAIRGIDRDRDYDHGYGYGRGYGMSPYEQVKTSHMAAKRPSGVAVAGLTVGVVGAVAGISAWIFGGMYGSAKAKEAAQIGASAKELAAAQYQASLNLLNTQNDNTQRTIDRILRGFETERQERINGDYTITQTVNDTVSGSQQGTLTAQQQAELAATQVATQQVMTGLMTGRYSENPQKVALWRDAQACPCPAGGCGCNG